MAKVVVASLKAKAELAGLAVTEKRIRNIEGKVETLRTLDAGSRTFGDDLRFVFGKNVAKARRDNKRTIGTNDVAVAKP